MVRDSGRTWTALAVALAIGVGASARSWAQDQPTTRQAVDDAEWKRQIEARMQQLEQENAELRKKVGAVAETQQAVMKDAESRGFLSLEGGQPHLTTPDFFDINKFASEGDFPGSFRIPGTKTSFQIGGYVQADTIFDGNPIGNEDSFVVNTIPTTGTGDSGAGNTNFSIRQTRLFLKTQTPTKESGDLVTYIEIDFQGTDGAEPRIRHAYGQIGDKFQFLAGQTWSAFQDATIFPAALDAQGPAGIINSRRPQLRFRQDFSNQWIGVVSIEDPNSDITVPAGSAGQRSTPYPDLDGNIRWQPDWGHVQLSGVLRYLQFDPDAGTRQSVVGYGLSLTGSVKTFRVDDKHVDSILYQVAGGNGITKYINDTGGLGQDAFLATPGSSLEGLNAFAGVLAYQHWWSEKWASTFGYSLVVLDNVAGEPGSDYHSGQYALINLRYFPAERVMIGGEILYGVREDNSGNSGDDLRLQFSAQYRF